MSDGERSSTCKVETHDGVSRMRWGLVEKTIASLLAGLLLFVITGGGTALLLMWRNDNTQDRALKAQASDIESNQESIGALTSLLNEQASALTRQTDAIERQGQTLITLMQRTEDRYTDDDAREDWSEQRQIDAAQYKLLDALDARQDASDQTGVRVATLLEKWDLQIDGNADAVKALGERLNRLEIRVESRGGGGE